jgi:hypothetical protein
MDATTLEQRVRTVHEDASQRAALLQALPQSKVAVLLDKALEDGRLAHDARPLVLNDREGRPMIAVFTAVERATPWVQREPAYGFALYTQLDWVVRIAPQDVGIAVNPGYRFDLTVSAAEVADMKVALQAAEG